MIYGYKKRHNQLPKIIYVSQEEWDALVPQAAPRNVIEGTLWLSAPEEFVAIRKGE